MFIFHTTALSKYKTIFLDTVKSMQQVLHFWNSRMFSLEGRIIIFKTLAISKIDYLTFLNIISNSSKELQKIQKTFIWHSSRSNISHKTLRNNFVNGGLKNADKSSKSWLRKLCDENFHEWKIIPSHLINKYLGNHSVFIHASALIANYLLNCSSFTKTFCFKGVALFLLFSELPSCILSNFLLFNKHILIEKKSSFFRYFSD